MSPEAWIALIGVLGTLFGTLFSAYLTSRAAAQREERQWQRQQRENRRREILDACQTFTELTLLHSIGVHQGEEVLMRAFVGVEMLGYRPLADEANELYQAAKVAVSDANKAKTAEEQREVMAEFGRAHSKFVDLVQEAAKEA